MDFGVEIESDVAVAGEDLSYDTLADARNAIHAWAPAQRPTIGSASWEIYEDTTPDPADFEIRVVYPLAPADDRDRRATQCGVTDT